MGILVVTKDTVPRYRRAHLEGRVWLMHALEPSLLIAVVFSVAGVIATLAAAVVAVDKLRSAWYHSEPKARVNRCTSIAHRPRRSKDCPVVARRKH